MMIGNAFHSIVRSGCLLSFLIMFHTIRSLILTCEGAQLERCRVKEEKDATVL